MVPVALTLITMLLSAAKEVKDLLKYKECGKIYVHFILITSILTDNDAACNKGADVHHPTIRI